MAWQYRELYDDLPERLAEETFSPCFYTPIARAMHGDSSGAPRRRLVVEMITMTSTNEHCEFEFAKNLIMEAGDLALQYFANVAELSISKGAQDMVSEADLAVETLIKKRLIAAYPEDAYLGEETGHVKRGFRNLGCRPD